MPSYKKKRSKLHKRKKSYKPKKLKKRVSKKLKRSTRKRRYSSKSKRRSYGRRRRFGSKGPGYKGPTSFDNGYVNYFGAPEPFVNASEWWYPNPPSKGELIGGAPTKYQSPNMIYKY